MSSDTIAIRSRLNKFTVVENYILEVHARKIGGDGFLLWCLLRKYADYQTGECYPKIATLADMMGCSRRTVERLMPVLENCGFLERESGALQGDANRYFVTAPKVTGCDNLTQGCDKNDVGGCDNLTHPYKEQQEPINNTHLTLSPPSSEVPLPKKPKQEKPTDPRYPEFIEALKVGYDRRKWQFSFNGADGKQMLTLLRDRPRWSVQDFRKALKHYFESEKVVPGDLPRYYLGKLPRYHAGPLTEFGKLADVTPAEVRE